MIDNCLKGEPPPAFDLLYWNADSTSLPGPMYAWYLRHMHLQNGLGPHRHAGVCVSRRRRTISCRGRRPTRSVQLLGGPAQFVLGASGHIPGVINPAAKNRRCRWIDGPAGDAATQRLAGATQRPGSWWTHWSAWLDGHRGGDAPTPKRLGHRRHPVIEPAPGRYVKVSSE